MQFIHDILTETLQPTYLEVIDESHRHIGHPGAASGGGHFAVIIAAKIFENKPLIACHRMIYQALAKNIGNQIHALRITVLRDPEPIDILLGCAGTH